MSELQGVTAEIAKSKKRKLKHANEVAGGTDDAGDSDPACTFALY